MSVALLLLLASAQGQESGYANRLALLPIVTEGDHGSASLSSIFDDVAAATSRRLGLRLISYEEMFAVSRDGLGTGVLECGPDTGCISSKLRSFNARMGLVAILDFSLDPPVISMQLIDTDAGARVADVVGELPSNDPERISAGIRAKTDEVLQRAGYVLAGKIAVEVDPPHAVIRLAGDVEPDKGTPNVFTVAPGRYTVSAEAEGYERGTTEAEIAGGTSTRVTLQLSEASSILESPWLWIGIGAVVAGGVTTGVLLGTRNSERCLCLTLDDVPCGC